MISVSDYSVAWLDGSVHEFLEGMGAPPSSMRYAVVTCLDSVTDVAGLLEDGDSLRHLRDVAQPLGTGIQLPTHRLLDAEERIFFGFDEVWFFPRKVRAPKPEAVGLAGLVEAPERLPEPLLNWMHENRCVLGLGDGVALVMAAKLQGAARAIVGSLVESLPATSDA